MAHGRLTQAEDGFESMMMRHGTTMLRLACVLLGNRQAAEDAVQEAMIRLYSRQERYAGQPHERQYVMKAVVNACRDIQRTSWHRRVTPTERMPEAAVAAGETNLTDALARLNPKLREVLLVRYYLGYGADEAGRMLGVSAGVVRERIRRAKTELEALLKESGSDDGQLFQEYAGSRTDRCEDGQADGSAGRGPGEPQGRTAPVLTGRRCGVRGNGRAGADLPRRHAGSGDGRGHSPADANRAFGRDGRANRRTR